MRSLLLAVAAASVVAVGCSAASDDVASSEAANTEGRPLTVIKGREWARCWFDTAGDSATLSCTSTARGQDPLAASVKVSAAGLNSPPGEGFEGFTKELDVEEGGTVVVGTFRRSSFPVMLILDASLSPDASALIGDVERLEIQSVPQIARPEDLDANAPAILQQPFDLWPMAFIDGSDQAGRFLLKAAEYTRSIAPYRSFLGKTEMKLRPYVVGSEARGKIHYFVAPPSGPIHGSLYVAGGEVATEMSQPGYYTVTNDGLRIATPAEIAVDFPGGSSPDVGGAEPAPDGGVEPAPPPPEPIDPDPSCGGAGQDRCNGTSCDNGTRYEASAGKCVACGDAGQTYCYDEPNNANRNAAWKCNAGTRYDSNVGTCVACGEAGQTYCYDEPNNTNRNAAWKCNAGTRYDSNAGKCVACGDAGETYCYDDPNNTNRNAAWKCNAGTRYDSNVGTCVACGEAGQTYCYDEPNNTNRNAAWKCNAGTRYDSDAAKCVACGAAGLTYCYSDPNNTNRNSTRVCNPGLRLDASSQKCVQ